MKGLCEWQKVKFVSERKLVEFVFRSKQLFELGMKQTDQEKRKWSSNLLKIKMKIQMNLLLIKFHSH